MTTIDYTKAPRISYVKTPTSHDVWDDAVRQVTSLHTAMATLTDAMQVEEGMTLSVAIEQSEVFDAPRYVARWSDSSGPLQLCESINYEWAVVGLARLVYADNA